MSSSHRRRALRWLARIALSISVLLICLALIELGFRVFAPARMEPDGLLKFRFPSEKPYRVTNVREPERLDLLRILNVGDSVTESECPRTLDLETSLSDIPSPVVFRGREFAGLNVMNGGLGGCDVRCILGFLKAYRGAGPTPHIVTVLSGWNEHWYKDKPCRRIDCHSAVPVLRMLHETGERLRGCRSCEALLNGIAHAGAKGQRADCLERLRAVATGELLQGIDHDDSTIFNLSLAEYEQTLEAIVAFLQDQDIEVILVVPPHGLLPGRVPLLTLEDCLLIDPDAFLPVRLRYTQTIRRVAHRHRLDLIDLEATFDSLPNRLQLFGNPDFDPIHPAAPGLSVCTDTFHQALAARLQPPAADAVPLATPPAAPAMPEVR